jgi:signal transduction histidine kinase
VSDTERRTRAELLAALRQKEAEFAQLADELEITNRGVIALHAELEAAREAEAQVAAVELQRFAEEQAALRRVATQVARAAPPEDVFAAVTSEVGLVLRADCTLLTRYGSGGVATIVGAWAKSGDVGSPVVGAPLELSGDNVQTRIFQTHQPARMDDYSAAFGPPAEVARTLGSRSAVGVPIDVADRLWGCMLVGSTHEQPLPPDTETRLAAFTELVGTALANAESQAALVASRARIVAAADAARQRIERDLHDGAQQRLVSLAIQLRAAKAALPGGQPAGQLDDIITEVTNILDELRQITSGLHPSALAEGGLAPALRTLARRSAIPVHLEIGIDRRLAEQVELAAYYFVAEALTNAAKHAHATVVNVTVEAADDVLRITVRDDGRGGAVLSQGSGLVGLTDRVEALGGSLSLDSPGGAGTTVAITLPAEEGRPPY